MTDHAASQNKTMRFGIKILVILIIILVILYSAVYVFIMLKGKALIVQKLGELSHRKVIIGSLRITPPFNLEINNLNIEDAAKIERIFVVPNVLYFLTGRIGLSRVLIIRPEITYERVSGGTTELSASTPSKKAIAAATPAKEKHPLRLIIKRLKIKEGKINFIDKTVGKEGLKIEIKDINFNLNNAFLFPFSAVTNFELKAGVPWAEGKEEGKISAEGWLNFFKKDMQATLKIEDIDGVYLYPYYSNWVDLEKARIESAKLNFTSNINGLNNNITAECRLELTDIVRKVLPEGESEEKAAKITDAVLDIFRALNQGKIVLNFTIRTKMDKPEFGFTDIRMAFEDKLTQGRKREKISVENVLTLPTKVLEGTVKGAADVSKAVIEGTFAVGNEIKKAIEEAFKKEKK